MIAKIKPHIQANDKYAFILAIGILFALNFLVFGLHYLGLKIFPWDFTGTYYAVPYFWTTCAQHGIFPTWISQQAMGYPLMMNLQSGLFYPPLWLLVLLHKTYTFHTAIVVQCLHVFAGAVGMFYLAKQMRLPWFYCLLAGIGYHFFGGFYSNAQHVDIIRGYALIPWLLAGIVVTKNQNDALKAAILIPLATLFIFTGAYPGIGMATAFMVAMFLLFQLIAPITDIPLKKRFIAIVIRGLWFSLGVLLSQIYLLAPWLLRNQILRSSLSIHQIQHSFFTIKNFFTLFLTANTPNFSQDISMRTVFITMPLFGMLFLARWKTIKQNIRWVLLLLIAIAMIMGSWFYNLVIAFIPFLKYSRFPSADYRAYIVIPLILFAVMALYDLIKKPLTLTALIIRNIVLFSVIFCGIIVIYHNSISLAGMTKLFTFLSLWIIFCILSLRIKQHPQFKTYSLILLIGLVVVNGFTMWYQNTSQWRASSRAHNTTQFININISKLQPKDIISSVRGRTMRPKRQNTNINPLGDWRGYLTGIYVLRDYDGGMQFTRQQTIISDHLLKQFMKLSSSYMLFAPKTKINIDMLKEKTSQNKIFPAKTKEIKMLHYSNNTIMYHMNLSNPALMVENETFFPGWYGKIIFQSGQELKINAVAAGSLLRAWELPAGNYRLITQFRMPYLRLGILLSLIGLILWVIGLVIVIKKYHYGKKQLS